MGQFGIDREYLTRGGLKAGVTGFRDHERIIDGWIEFPDGRTKASWYHDGRMHKDGDDKFDLMPPTAGPREIIDPEYDTTGGWRHGDPGMCKPEYDVSRLGPNGSVRREAVTEVDTFGGPRPKHENVTDRLDRIEAMLLRYTDSFGVRIVKLMNAVELNQSVTKARLAKSDEEAALNLVATDARLDRLSGIIDEHEKRFAALREAL